MTPVRLALVGYGRWGRHYVTAARESGEAEVAAIVKRGESIPYAVDAVVIATHPSVSPGLCVRALATGKPVMLEKPAGLSLEDAERIQCAEAVSGKFVLVNHQHLFADQYERIRSLGAPRRAIAVFSGPIQRDYPPEWDYGSHAVACLLGLGIDPVHGDIHAGMLQQRNAKVMAFHDSGMFIYDGYDPAELSLTRSVRAFARAVRAGGTDDWRFGAHWAVDVARVLTSALR